MPFLSCDIIIVQILILEYLDPSLAGCPSHGRLAWQGMNGLMVTSKQASTPWNSPRNFDARTHPHTIDVSFHSISQVSAGPLWVGAEQPVNHIDISSTSPMRVRHEWVPVQLNCGNLITQSWIRHGQFHQTTYDSLFQRSSFTRFVQVHPAYHPLCPDFGRPESSCTDCDESSQHQRPTRSP